MNLFKMGAQYRRVLNTSITAPTLKRFIALYPTPTPSPQTTPTASEGCGGRSHPSRDRRGGRGAQPSLAG